MKTPKGSLCHLIAESFGFETTSAEFYAVFAHTVSYITRGTDYAAYQDRIRPFCRGLDFSPKDFRLRLHVNEYMSLAIKLYVLRLGKTRSVTQADAKKYRDEYKLFNCDAKALFKFWQHQRKMRKRIRTEAREYDVGTHLNMQVLKQTLHMVLKPVSKYVKSFTYRKLRFLCESQNTELRDMHADLLIDVVSAFHKLMPCTMEPAHVVNYLKRSAHNSGINRIEAGTSLKGGRLVGNKDRDGNWGAATLLVMSENQMRVSADADPVSYEELAGHSPIETVDIEHSVETIVSSVKPGGKKYRFLTILMGDHCDKFTNWLQSRKHCTPKESNTDLQDRIEPARFNMLLGRFLGVDNDKVERFMQKLRTSLDPYSDNAVAA